MAAEDELALPQVPEAKPDDPEDVSWSLSTAEAMWARGDHLEGIKWVRKAAEAASDVEDDERALELAKAASELATIVARRSRASLGAGGMADGHGFSGGTPPEASYTAPPTSYTGPPTSAQPVSSPPTTTRSHAPPAPSHAMPSGPPSPLPGRSSPPIPLPSMASQPPRSLSPSPPSGRAPPRPLATNDARQGPQAGRGILSNRTAEKAKSRRRSRDGLEGEARTAGVVETAPMRAVDGDTADRTLGRRDPLSDTGATRAVEVPMPRARRRSRPDPDPTIVARLEDLQPHRQKSAEEWDASPTQNLSGDEMDHRLSAEGDRMTTAFAVPSPPVAPSVPPPPMRAPQSTVHDPEIQTTQAVRVVVWRDANGVHVAPAGTVVSAIKIDAVLVVLEEGADLTAWLSQRER
jgi:hypothetical protein